MFSFLFSDAHSHRLWEPEWTVGRSLTTNFHFTDVETGLTVSMAFPRQHRTSLEHNWGYSRATCAPPPQCSGATPQVLCAQTVLQGHNPFSLIVQDHLLTVQDYSGSMGNRYDA